MTSFCGKFNLLKFKNSCILSIKGKSEIKKGVFIPIDDNNLFVSADENLKAKGAYFDFNAWENQQVGKYGDTHSIRQSISKEVRDKMAEEELKAIPYLGNMKPYEASNLSATVNAPVANIEEDDDLPF